MSHYERHKQVIGRYEVFLRGQDADVIMRSGTVERNMTALEALGLLEWLYQHKDEIYRASASQETQEGS